jgi:hypothetical protein
MVILSEGFDPFNLEISGLWIENRLSKGRGMTGVIIDQKYRVYIRPDSGPHPNSDFSRMS